MPTSELQKQLAKLRRDKKILWLGILFFVLVVLWILVSIFTTSRTSSISPELRKMALPFVPRLESKVFEEIMVKRVFTEEELSLFSIYVFDENSSSDNPSTIDIVGKAEIETEIIETEFEAEINSSSASAEENQEIVAE